MTLPLCVSFISVTLSIYFAVTKLYSATLMIVYRSQTTLRPWSSATLNPFVIWVRDHMRSQLHTHTHVPVSRSVTISLAAMRQWSFRGMSRDSDDSPVSCRASDRGFSSLEPWILSN